MWLPTVAPRLGSIYHAAQRCSAVLLCGSPYCDILLYKLQCMLLQSNRLTKLEMGLFTKDKAWTPVIGWRKWSRPMVPYVENRISFVLFLFLYIHTFIYIHMLNSISEFMLVEIFNRVRHWNNICKFTDFNELSRSYGIVIFSPLIFNIVGLFIIWRKLTLSSFF